MLPVKKDPAPSRLAYRLERLWLRPAVRHAVRRGLPALVALGCFASLGLDPQVQAEAAHRAKALRDTIAAHPALAITEVEVSTLSPDLAAALGPVLDLSLPISSMDLDLPALHARIVAHEAVASAHLRIAGGGKLAITITERHPSAVWREDERLWLLDATGHRIRIIDDRAEAPGLPLIAGIGAEDAVAEALELMERAAPLSDRVRGLVRVGERRWTLTLTEGPDILLPETGAGAALSRVIALDQAEDLLARDVARVDMRDGRRPVLQLTPRAVEALHRARNPVPERDA